MTRRYGPRTNGKRFVGNGAKKEVHDLDREDPTPSGCQIDEIIRAANARTFDPDTLSQAHAQGYDNCAKCIGQSRR